LVSFFPGGVATPTGEIEDEDECTGPHDDKVSDHWDKDAEDVADIIQDSLGLFSADQNDSINQPLLHLTLQ